MTPPDFIFWLVLGFAGLVASVCLGSRRAIWTLFCLGLAAITLHEGIECFSGWIFANARAGHAFEQWLTVGMSSWHWHVALSIVLNPLKALVIAPLLAWGLRLETDRKGREDRHESR